MRSLDYTRILLGRARCCFQQTDRRFTNRSGRHYLALPTPAAGLLKNLSYFAVSDGAHSISGISKWRDCNLKDNLSRATQGFVYIFGSVILIDDSKWSAPTRRYVASTCRAPLCGRPALSIQVSS